MKFVAVMLAASLGLWITACAAEKSAQTAAVSSTAKSESGRVESTDAYGPDPDFKVSGTLLAAGNPADSTNRETAETGAETSEPPPTVARPENDEEPVRDAKEAAEEAARKIFDATVEAASRIKEAGISAVQAVRETTARNNGESGSTEKEPAVAANGIEDSGTGQD